MTFEDARSALRTIETPETARIESLSHRYARYVTPLSGEGDYITRRLVLSSTTALRHLRLRLNSMSAEQLREMVSRF